MSLSTFDKTTHVDLVKPVSDEYFIQNLCYFLKDEAINAMGRQRPLLDSDRRKVIQGDEIDAWYKQYSELWFCFTLYNNEQLDESYRYRVKMQAVTEKMKDMAAKPLYARQTMALYNLAAVKTVPGFAPYVVHAKDFIPGLKVYLLSEAKVNEWVDAIASPQPGADTSEFFTYKLHELKSKLDLLDPSFDLSNEIIGSYNEVLLARYSQNLTDTELNKNIYKTVISKLLKAIQSDPTNKFYNLLSQVTASMDFKVFKKRLTSAITMSLRSADTSETGVLLQTFDEASKGSVASLQDVMIEIKTKPTLLSKITQLSNYIMLTCQTAAVIYGFVNFGKLDTFQKALVIGNTLGIFSEIVSNYGSFKVFMTMGKFITNSIGKISVPTLAKTFVDFSSKMLTSKVATLFLKSVAPILLIVSACLTAIDAFNDFKNQNWVALGIDIAEIGLICGTFVLMFSSSAYAGPIALIIGGIAIALEILKMILFPQPDPIATYLNSVAAKYCFTEREMTIFWNSSFWNSDAPTGSSYTINQLIQLYKDKYGSINAGPL